MFGHALLGAGNSLVELVDLVKANKHQPPQHVLSSMFRCMDMHIKLAKEAKLKMTPKHHLMCHLLTRLVVF